MRSILLIAAAALAFAACDSAATAQQAAAPAPGSIAVTPPNFRMPQGEGCAADIARYRAVQDNDLAMGHVARSVYNQIKKEIAVAEAQCAAGRDAEALATLRASRVRHGYPADL